MNRQGRPRRRSAFSLIEIVVALGITASALLAILGLLALIIGEARESAARTIGSQISTRLMGEIQSLRWDEVDAFMAVPAHQYRHFDEFGEQLTSTTAPTGDPEQDSVYTAHLEISADPGAAAAGSTLSMTTAGAARPNGHLRQATVYVAALPGPAGKAAIVASKASGEARPGVFVQHTLVTHFEKK